MALSRRQFIRNVSVAGGIRVGDVAPPNGVAARAARRVDIQEGVTRVVDMDPRVSREAHDGAGV